MRKKGNLDIRIENSGDYLIATEGTFTNALDFIKTKEYINKEELFGNNNNLELDLGCGLGAFSVIKAINNPNINYIGVEKFSNIIIAAIDKARKEKVSNLKFLNCRVECIEKYVEDDSVDVIYLNFSNPLPNKTDEKHRLTSKRYLEIYKKILKDSGRIEQKTDDLDFFEFSLESFKNCGYRLEDICYDVANANIEGNIVTEHESKYMLEGKKIYRVVAYKN